ncbi:MAG: hypothetical protein WC069_00110 [Candidatus Shapirobacteria bacterium]
MDLIKDQPLAQFTTLKIGGPADYFIQTNSTTELVNLLQTTNIHPVTILGNGSNVLISDTGIRGLVIKNTSNEINIQTNTPKITNKFNKTYTQRQENEPEKYLDFTKIDYDESSFPSSEVEISSGCLLSYVINWTLDHNLTGLQWFAYIPGTIAGAIVQNIHGGSYHLSDYVKSIKCYDLNTKSIIQFNKSDLNWQYEQSYFLQNPNLIILSTILSLFQGDAGKAKKVKDAWIAQKIKVQPMNSPGSAFQNPSKEICQKIWGEQKSTGWIIDHELNLKGFSIGDAQISLQHSNFFVNNGHATATDYYKLIQHVQNLVKTKFGFDLIPEIKFLGDFSTPSK